MNIFETLRLSVHEPLTKSEQQCARASEKKYAVLHIELHLGARTDRHKNSVLQWYL